MASLLQLPAKGRVTQDYSVSHRGIDYGWGNGREVYAAADGKISYERNVYGYGNRLTIDHGALIGKGTLTKYCHLLSAVRSSGEVKRGELIGYMGSTGSYAAYVHLHFELHITVGIGYVKSDPSRYFTDTSGGTIEPIPPTLDPRKKNSMTTLYYEVKPDSSRNFALAGDGVGGAAWLETGNQERANAWAKAHHIEGGAILLNAATFEIYRNLYQSSAPVNATVTVTAPPVTVESDPAVAAALAEIIALLKTDVVSSRA